MSSDYDVQVSRGAISRVEQIDKFGRNSDFGLDTDEDVWDGGGDWVAPTQARIHNIASTSDDDTDQGAGAWSIKIFGVDGDFSLRDEVVLLAGTTNVPTTYAYLNIFRKRVLTSNAGVDAVGDITATAQVDGTVTAQINTPNNNTLMAIYTVPAGHVLQLCTLYFTLNADAPGAAATASANVRMLVRNRADPNNPWALRHLRGAVATGNSAPPHVWKPPLPIQEKSDIKLRFTDIIPAAMTGADASAGWTGYLVRG